MEGMKKKESPKYAIKFGISTFGDLTLGNLMFFF
jgi:hypothetical protein